MGGLSVLEMCSSPHQGCLVQNLSVFCMQVNMILEGNVLQLGFAEQLVSLCSLQLPAV